MIRSISRIAFILIATPLLASACSEPTAPRPLEANTGPSVDLISEDGIQWALDGAEYVPVGEVKAKILLPYTKMYFSCGDFLDGCAGEIVARHSGYWHETSIIVDFEVETPFGVHPKAKPKFTDSKCQRGAHPCLWKSSDAQVTLGLVPTCGVKARVTSTHEAAFNTIAAISFGVLSFGRLAYGQALITTADTYSNPACKPVVVGGGGRWLPDCTYCVDWLVYVAGELVETIEDCQRVSCGPLLT